MNSAFFSFRDFRRAEHAERAERAGPPKLGRVDSRYTRAWLAWRLESLSADRLESIDAEAAAAEAAAFGPLYEADLEARVAAVRALKAVAGNDGPSIGDVDAALGPLPLRSAASRAPAHGKGGAA